MSGCRLRGALGVILLLLLLTLTLSPIAGFDARADSRLPPAYYADRPLPDPHHERAARGLMDSIRCLVCEGQSVGDSNAEMAGDMRALIRRHIAAGESPEAVRHWLIERYGKWISYDPPFDWATAPLWIAPWIVLGLGAVLVWGRLGRRAKSGPPKS